MGELCRLCALEKDNLVGIYEDEGHRLHIESKIKKCLRIEVTLKKNLPTRVCLECCTKLDAFDEFLENTLNAQATLCVLFPEVPDKNITRNECLDIEFKELGNADDEDYDLPDDRDVDPFECPELEKLKNDRDYGRDIFEKETLEDKKISLVNWQADDKVGQHNGSKPVCDQKIVSADQSENESDNQIKNIEWEFKPWMCTDCSEEFKLVEDLRLHHANEHNQDVRYMCRHCSKQFLVYNTFISHIKRHKNGVKYSCDECGKGFSNKKVLDSHRVTHSDSRPFACEQCGKAFRQQSALYIHSRCHLPDDVKNKYPCDQCNKRFSTKPNLVTHKRIHTGVRNYTCDQCGKSFIQKGNLDAHLLTHSHDKPFSCELCNKSFKTGMQLRKHESVHTGARPHECEVCGRRFRERGTLREHSRIHTGAMPFTCEYCGKAFRFKGILTTHRRQHTGERPYSCHDCQHHFTNWPNYNKHMKRRHGVNTSRTATATATRQFHESPSQPPPPPYVPYTVYNLPQAPSIVDPSMELMHRDSCACPNDTSRSKDANWLLLGHQI